MAEAQQQPVAGERPEDEKKRHRSKGERWFDFIVYGPVNYVGTFVISAVLAVLQKRKLPFIHEKVGDWMKGLGVAAGLADNVLVPTLLTSWGGSLMVIPLKLAEDHKVKIIEKLNRWKGDKADPDEIAQAPKQTWGSLIAGRLTVIALVLPAMYGLSHSFFGKHMDAGAEATGQRVAKWMRTPAHRGAWKELLARQSGLEAMKKAAPLSEAAEKELAHVTRSLEHLETVPYAFGKMLAIDTFVTIVAVTVLYIASHLFAKKEAQHHERKEKKREAGQPTIALESPLIVTETPAPKETKDKPRAEILAGAVSAEKALTMGRDGVQHG